MKNSNTFKAIKNKKDKSTNINNKDEIVDFELDSNTNAYSGGTGGKFGAQRISEENIYKFGHDSLFR